MLNFLPFAQLADLRMRTLQKPAQLGHLLTQRGDLPAGGVSSLFSTEALLDYIMICCQVKYGGLRDKPGKGRDFYHTCYCLSGLAVAGAEPPDTEPSAEPSAVPTHWRTALTLINPVYNISAEKVDAAIAHFKR